MSRYALEISAPFTAGSQDNNANLLAAEANLLADLYGGTVEQPGLPAPSRYVLTIKNLEDYVRPLLQRVESLRRMFPGASFATTEQSPS